MHVLLSSPLLPGLLLVLLGLDLLWALFLPRHGLGVFFSFLVLAAYIGLGLARGNIDGRELFLMAAGLVLLLSEVVIPGFGIIGVTGILLLSTGLVLGQENTQLGLASFFAALVFSLLLGLVLVKAGFRSKRLEKLILRTSLTSREGYLSKEAPLAQVGDRGISVTNLRPSGKIRLDQGLVEATTEGAFIAKDRPVVVLALKNAQIIVEEVEN